MKYEEFYQLMLNGGYYTDTGVPAISKNLEKLYTKDHDTYRKYYSRFTKQRHKEIMEHGYDYGLTPEKLERRMLADKASELFKQSRNIRRLLKKIANEIIELDKIASKQTNKDSHMSAVVAGQRNSMDWALNELALILHPELKGKKISVNSIDGSVKEVR